MAQESQPLHPKLEYDTRSWGYELPVDATNFLNDLFPKFEVLVTYHPAWPVWKVPQSCLDPSSVQWLNDLSIPATPNGDPNLLLHQLGTLDTSALLNEPLLRSNMNHFLMNASGSGKTRLALDSLCSAWGFYYTLKSSLTHGNELGSNDLRDCVRRMRADAMFEPDLIDSISLAFHKQLKKNEEISLRCLSHVLLARHLIFHVFLDAIEKSRCTAKPEDRKCWVMLQVYPTLAPGLGTDIFYELAHILGEPRDNSLISFDDSRIKVRLFRKLREKIQALEKAVVQILPLFSVVDDIQLFASELPHAFRLETRSETDPPTQYTKYGPESHRSLLRQLFIALIPFIQNGSGSLGVGTPIELREVEEAMHSSVRQGERVTTKVQTGVFDPGKSTETNLEYKAYIRQYLPPKFLESPSGRLLLYRITRWLFGRYRLTADFITFLLRLGLQNPHTALDDWISYHTGGFKPTDGLMLRRLVTNPSAVQMIENGHRLLAGADSNVENSQASNSSDITPDIRPQNALHEELPLHKLRVGGFMPAAAQAVFDSFLRRNIRGITAGAQLHAVEAGFAKLHQTINDTHISEPILVLAGMHRMETEQDGYGANEHTLTRHIVTNVGDNSTHHNGFEDLSAFIIAEIFAKSTPLDLIFKPRAGAPVPNWFRREARLVVLAHEFEDKPTIYDVNLPAREGPSGQFGRACEGPSDVLKFLKLQDRLRPAICFPDKRMGPDILCFLELQATEDEEACIILLMVQCKFHSSAETRALNDAPKGVGGMVRAAARSILPDECWVTEKGVKYQFQGKDLCDLAKEAFLKIPNGLSEQSRYPIMRVVVMWPPSCTLEEAAAENPSRKKPLAQWEDDHLLVTFNWDEVGKERPYVQEHIEHRERLYIARQEERRENRTIPRPLSTDTRHSSMSVDRWSYTPMSMTPLKRRRSVESDNESTSDSEMRAPTRPRFSETSMEGNTGRQRTSQMDVSPSPRHTRAKSNKKK